MSDYIGITRDSKVIVKRDIPPFFKRGQATSITYVSYFDERYAYNVKLNGFGSLSVRSSEVEPLEEFNVR